jgi:hypothetical protein
MKKFCKDHNKKKQEYKAKYFQEKQQKTKTEGMNQKIIDIQNTDDVDKLSNITRLEIKSRHTTDTLQICMQEIIGIKLFLGCDEEKLLSMTRDILHGGCKCDVLVDEGELDEENAHTIYGCKRCSSVHYNLPSGVKRRIYEFKGTIAQAKKKSAKKLIKCYKLKEKIKLQQQIIKEIRKRREELSIK